MSDQSTNAEARLVRFLLDSGQETAVSPLTPDASTRVYFRVRWNGAVRVACVYPEAFGPDLPFIDTTRLYSAAGLPVAEIVTYDGGAGILIQEDLGSRSLADELAESDSDARNSRIDGAISLIADIQKATSLAEATGSIASKLKFDQVKLKWELGFFLEHYFGSLLNAPLNKALEQSVKKELSELAEELESYSTVLTHRDFHAANLLVGDDGALRIIDHQDSRLGSAAYDLVSLLLDRIKEPPAPEALSEKRSLLLKLRKDRGLAGLGSSDFEYEFELVSIQRCLKAVGTFANQAGNYGRLHYTAFIPAMFGTVKGACERLGRFPAIREMLFMAGGEAHK